VVLDDIAVYLQTQGLGTRGSTIFEGRIPPDAPGGGVADQIIALFSVPGLPPQHVHDIVGPAVEQPMVQVRVRGSAAQGGYAAMWALAEQAGRLLDSVRNLSVNGTFYLAIMLQQAPVGLPEDQYQRPSLVFHVRCTKAAS
jgi:hypothetical protein